MGRSRKPLYGQLYRGFESLPLRCYRLNYDYQIEASLQTHRFSGFLLFRLTLLYCTYRKSSVSNLCACHYTLQVLRRDLQRGCTAELLAEALI